MFNIMVIKVRPREVLASKVQDILTSYGNIIQTRLGIHENGGEEEDSCGLIILNLVEKETGTIKELEEKLNNLDGVIAKILLI